MIDEALFSNICISDPSKPTSLTNILPTIIDDASCDNNSMNVLDDKYSNLYNNVPYDPCQIDYI